MKCGGAVVVVTVEVPKVDAEPEIGGVSWQFAAIVLEEDKREIRLS